MGQVNHKKNINKDLCPQLLHPDLVPKLLILRL